MRRISLIAILTFILGSATAASAQPQPPPCVELDGEALEACLAEVVESGVKLRLPRCDEGDEATRKACVDKRKRYQRVLVELTGDPCVAMFGEKREACQNRPPPADGPCAGLEGDEATACREKHDKDREGAADAGPCAGLEGDEAAQCREDHKKDREGAAETGPCAGLEGDERERCREEHKRQGGDDAPSGDTRGGSGRR